MKARVLAVVTVLLALSACGPADKASPGSGTGAAGDTAAAGPTPTKSINVCVVLPAPQAAKLAGQAYTEAVDNAKQSGWTSGCAYDDEDSTGVQGVNVNVDTSDRVQDTWKLVHTGSISEIKGLGDQAFWDNDNTLYALKGNALVQVNGLDSEDKSEALAKFIIAQL